jgi:hypothetical protein
MKSRMWGSVSFLERRMFAHVFCYKVQLKPDLLDRLAILNLVPPMLSRQRSMLGTLGI